MSTGISPIVGDPFDELAARVRAAAEPCRVIAVTSAVFGEGVSSAALGLALTLANTQSEAVLLVDANWLDPWLSTSVADGPQHGLAEVLRGELRFADAVLGTSKPLLSVLPAGVANLAEHRLDGLAVVIGEARKRFRYVIVDLPPILASLPLILPWTSAVDQMFVTVRGAATPTALVRKALAAIEPTLVPSLIFNGARRESATIQTPRVTS